MITSETAKAGPFVGDGETLIFDFSFTALDADQVAVYVDGVKVTTGFTVELLTGGGRVTFEAAPAIDASIAIIRDVPAKQEMDLQNNTAFLPEVIETAFDRLTMMIQQLRDLFSRTPVAPPTEDTTSEELYSRFAGALDALEAYVAAVDGTVDTKITTHDDNALAHGAIRAQIGTDVGVHNSSSLAHTAIQTKIGTDIGIHNSSGTAHAGIRKSITDTFNTVPLRLERIEGPFSYSTGAVGGIFRTSTGTGIQYMLASPRVKGSILMTCSANRVEEGITFYTNRFYDAFVKQGDYYFPAVPLRGASYFFVPESLYLVNPTTGAPVEITSSPGYWSVSFIFFHSIS